ncbi:hypothetical protein ACFQX9_35290 [Bradyrhizobium sp. GCM10028915]|uniref:hypothetical protein n=1 Tax=Bradyrhizobium sp. GCM10028915 TaxID=3273385 RepID=UPI00361A69C8
MDAVDMLQAAGFDILEAANADEAILLLENHSNVRLIFTDIDMPRNFRVFQNRAGDLPADARFIPKPYMPIQIIDAIHELTSTV